MSNAYRYTDEQGEPTAHCPACGPDWAAGGGVLVEVEHGRPAWEGPSRQAADGRLVGVADLVANGLHSAPLCSGCRQMLIDLEGVLEHQEAADDA